MRRRNHLNLLFEDDDILVVNKPAPFLSIPDHFNPDLPNLADLLNEMYGRVFVVHRLDRDTSGIVLFAKNEDAHRALSRQFEHHSVQKTYVALVDGRLATRSGCITFPLREDIHHSGRTEVDERHGKPSETSYRVLEQFGNSAFVEVMPKTGRMHQIRAHFKAIGHPLLIDPLYGIHSAIYLSQMKLDYKLTAAEERPLMARLTLHAWRLSFAHPGREKILTFEAPLQKDFAILLKYLRKHQIIFWDRLPSTTETRPIRRKSRQRWDKYSTTLLHHDKRAYGHTASKTH